MSDLVIIDWLIIDIVLLVILVRQRPLIVAILERLADVKNQPEQPILICLALLMRRRQ